MSSVRRDRVDPPAGDKRRTAIQTAFAVLLNGYIAGFARGSIYKGRLKFACVPVLNCYSCPGALGSCPIGSLQAVAGSPGRGISFYVLGLLMLFGIAAGRLVCGFMCPFGFIQDLLYKIPVRKIKVPQAIDRVGRYVKYLVLIFAVMLIPAVTKNEFGISEPFFCKYICPAGTLEAGIPLMITNSSLRAAAGGLFILKLAILAVVVILAMKVSRCFCKYLCPLGAFYSLFNRVSLYRLEVDDSTCVKCGTCASVCPMDIDVTSGIGGAECIKCGRCRSACPAHSITVPPIITSAGKNCIEKKTNNTYN